MYTRRVKPGSECPRYSDKALIDSPAWHTGIDAKRRPFEVTNFVMRADYAALDYDMRVED